MFSKTDKDCLVEEIWVPNWLPNTGEIMSTFDETFYSYPWDGKTQKVRVASSNKKRITRISVNEEFPIYLEMNAAKTLRNILNKLFPTASSVDSEGLEVWIETPEPNVFEVWKKTFGATKAGTFYTKKTAELFVKALEDAE